VPPLKITGILLTCAACSASGGGFGSGPDGGAGTGGSSEGPPPGGFTGTGGMPSGGGGALGGAPSGGSSGQAGSSTTGPAGTPAAIEAVSGNGAALLEGWPGGTLKVRILDPAGAPVPAVDVVWSIQSGEGVNITSPGLPTTPTDASGISARTIQGAGFSASTAYGQAVVRATASVGSVDFVAVTVHQTSSGPIGPWIALKAPETLDLGDLKVGTILPKAAKLQAAIQAGAFSGQALPNVGLRFVDSKNHDLPGAVDCAGGPALTDATGVAECDLQVGSELGDHYIAAIGGETTIFNTVHVHVVP
jgi:hypothetical protein